MLLLDNAPGYLEVNLPDPHPHVKVIFLPPNTTSLIQPMDQRLIRTFKTLYTRGAFDHFNEAKL